MKKVYLHSVGLTPGHKVKRVLKVRGVHKIYAFIHAWNFKQRHSFSDFHAVLYSFVTTEPHTLLHPTASAWLQVVSHRSTLAKTPILAEKSETSRSSDAFLILAGNGSLNLAVEAQKYYILEL